MNADTIAIVLFDETDSSGLRVGHDELISSAVGKTCADLRYIRGSATAIHSVSAQLKSLAIQISRSLDRPIRVLVDLSSSPRYYSLLWLSWGVTHGWISELSYSYAEGHYPEKDAIEDPLNELDNPIVETAFTERTKKTVPIPYLTGQTDPEKQKQFVVSLGFEGSKAYRVLQEADPDNVMAILPSPGTMDGYEERTVHANQGVLSDFGIRTDLLLRAHAGNPAECWRVLSNSPEIDYGRYNVSFVLCGTKPHALGMSLSAIQTRKPSVLYNIPTTHNVVEVLPNGHYWRYDIKDHSAPI